MSNTQELTGHLSFPIEIWRLLRIVLFNLVGECLVIRGYNKVCKINWRLMNCSWLGAADLVELQLSWSVDGTGSASWWYCKQKSRWENPPSERSDLVRWAKTGRGDNVRDGEENPVSEETRGSSDEKKSDVRKKSVNGKIRVLTAQMRKSQMWVKVIWEKVSQ